MLLVRFFQPDLGSRVGVELEDTVYDVTSTYGSVTEWLYASIGRVDAAVNDLRQTALASQDRVKAAWLDNPPDSEQPHWLAPVDKQDVWASGVTYERSREARQEEAIDGGDVYARVYSAARPELFFKAHGRHVMGMYGEVGIRRDATWSVPEPELAVVLNPALEVVGFSAGNDMSSRDIEGENPLYLPQAKVYEASCSLGRGIWLGQRADFPETTISLTIERGGKPVVEASVSTARIKRSLSELVDYLGRCLSFDRGAVLLTGTGIVPPNDFTLQAGDRVTIDIDGISQIVNTVRVV